MKAVSDAVPVTFPHTMRRAAALALLVATLAATDAAALAACHGVRFVRPEPSDEPGPVPPNPIGCRHGISLRVETGTTLWRCQVLPAEGQDDLPEGVPDYAFLVERPGEPIQVLPDDLMAGRYAAFHVAIVDLDGDGKTERVLAAWNTQGNGLGVNSWTIRVFDGAWRLLRQFDNVSEWGERSLVRGPRGAGRCDLAVTAFVGSFDGRGRSGISLQARFFRLSDGRVQEAPDHPAIERRYDFAFERERSRWSRRRDGETTGDVVAWLSHPRTIVSPKR